MISGVEVTREAKPIATTGIGLVAVTSQLTRHQVFYQLYVMDCHSLPKWRLRQYFYEAVCSGLATAINLPPLYVVRRKELGDGHGEEYNRSRKHLLTPTHNSCPAFTWFFMRVCNEMGWVESNVMWFTGKVWWRGWGEEERATAGSLVIRLLAVHNTHNIRRSFFALRWEVLSELTVHWR